MCMTLVPTQVGAFIAVDRERTTGRIDELDARRLPLLVERFRLCNDLDDVPRPVELFSKLLP